MDSQEQIASLTAALRDLSRMTAAILNGAVAVDSERYSVRRGQVDALVVPLSDVAQLLSEFDDTDLNDAQYGEPPEALGRVE